MLCRRFRRLSAFSAYLLTRTSWCEIVTMQRRTSLKKEKAFFRTPYVALKSNFTLFNGCRKKLKIDPFLSCRKSYEAWPRFDEKINHGHFRASNISCLRTPSMSFTGVCHTASEKMHMVGYDFFLFGSNNLSRC